MHRECYVVLYMQCTGIALRAPYSAAGLHAGHCSPLVTTSQIGTFPQAVRTLKPQMMFQGHEKRLTAEDAAQQLAANHTNI